MRSMRQKKNYCQQCEVTAESQGRRPRQWRSLLGSLTLKRRYVHCAACERGFSPSHKLIGLPEGEFTAHLEDVVTMMATTVPYAMATKLIAKSCGIDVSVKAVEQMIERRASVLCALDAAEAQLSAPYDARGLPMPEQFQPVGTVAVNKAPDVAYLEIDGVIPITREPIPEVQLSKKDRKRLEQAKLEKARGGKARRYEIVGREVKNAVLYDGKDCAETGSSRGSILEKTYVSHLGDWLSFALLLWVAIVRLRFDKARKLVVLSDGAEWIRSLAAWLPIPTLLILDLFHAKHRIWEVANSLHGAHTPKAKEWAEIQCDRIEAGHVDKVLHALKFIRTTRAEARELIDKLYGYLDGNRDRMNYPDYRAQGLRVTTSAVESANFHVTGTRLKLQGMRWTEDGARHMAALRADLFNDRWEQRSGQILAA